MIRGHNPELVACWALVRGTATGSFPGSTWPEIFQQSIRERCAPLAWARSQHVIEAHAPHDVSVKWASTAWIAQERMQAQLVALREVTRWFAAHDVPLIILKGMPLAQRLYGSPWVRPTDDMDVYVPPEHHRAALDLFQGTGWTRFSGDFPNDVVLRKTVLETPVAVDLHFSIGGPWHQHLPLPRPTAETIQIEGTALPAIGGAFLPAYLAAHLLQHSERPLLWLSDFTALIESLSDGELAAARAAAAEAHLQRVLDRVIGWARAMDGMSASASDAERDAFISEALRPSRARAIQQLITSSATLRDAFAIVSRFIWPAEMRHDPRGLAAMWRRRVGRLLKRPE